MFTNRPEAGRQLAAELRSFRDDDVVVLGLPRGGVPVAYEVAQELGAPLDVILVRKLGVPYEPELAMGAIGEGGVRVMNDEIVRESGVSESELAAVAAREHDVLERRAEVYRSGRERVPLAGRVAIIVDDGIATGATIKAACQVARAHGARRIVLAVPVGPREVRRAMGDVADEIVCLTTPWPFFGIGQAYEDFSPTSNDEVVACLDAAGRPRTVPQEAARPGGTPPATASRTPPAAAGGMPPAARDEDLSLPGPPSLGGHLTVPEQARGLVIFAHGSGSSRHSPRNRYVAGLLNDAGLATLLFDLLTTHEEHSRANVFDIELLAERLAGASRWAGEQPGLGELPVGYFGASTGAAAALRAAAEPGARTRAVVSRGGRPDLAIRSLSEVRAPTLLIVGALDTLVLQLNREAQAGLRCENRLEVVAGATHLFEEPGTLQVAAELAASWFTTHLAGSEVNAGPRR